MGLLSQQMCSKHSCSSRMLPGSCLLLWVQLLPKASQQNRASSNNNSSSSSPWDSHW
jgi:hypothetical protein